MATILWQRTVIRDNWHNMATDLCSWNNGYWLTFRRGTTHSSTDGAIVVIHSTDLKSWDEVALFKTNNNDRGPKLITNKDKLYLYFASWQPETENGTTYEIVVNFVSTTDDGVHWSEPLKIYKPHIWIWNVRIHNGTFYSPAYGWEDPGPKPGKMRMRFLDFLCSPDGYSWEKVSRIAQVGEGAGEADLIFRPDGELWCISRTSHSRWCGDNEKSDESVFYISKPPYKEWECMDLKLMIHCPVFCETGGKVYLTGRRDTAVSWTSQTTPAGNTALFLVERGKVKPLVALPTAGDASYPGLISCESGKLLISYYSQHAYLSGVIQSPSSKINDDTPSDIYIAEIEV